MMKRTSCYRGYSKLKGKRGMPTRNQYKPIPQKRVEEILKKLELLKQTSNVDNRITKDGTSDKDNKRIVKE